MAHRVCPWWLGYFLINPFRRLLQDPRKILGEYLKEGMTALEPGPGLGFFTLEMARMVGPSGHVVTVDTQPRMVEGLKHRVSKAGFTDRIDCRLATSENLRLEDYEGRIDFALVFAMAHEVSDLPRFLYQVAKTLKPGAKILLAEPKAHVSQSNFDDTCRLAQNVRLLVKATPKVSGSRAVLLVKDGG